MGARTPIRIFSTEHRQFLLTITLKHEFYEFSTEHRQFFKFSTASVSSIINTDKPHSQVFTCTNFKHIWYCHTLICHVFCAKPCHWYLGSVFRSFWYGHTLVHIFLAIPCPVFWSRWLVCATRDGGRKQSWPLFFSFYFFCFSLNNKTSAVFLCKVQSI